MKPKKIKINVPEGFTIVKNELTDYNPQSNFSEDNNLFYLQEDLFQTTNESTKITIDLGWYGDIIKNKGTFKIFIIKDNDWGNPIKIKESKSIIEIHEMLKDEIKNL